MSDSQNELRRQEIKSNLEKVRQRMEVALEGRSQARLVAVSKLKPIFDILCAYEAGQRHFGENYVQELIEKSKEVFFVLVSSDEVELIFIRLNAVVFNKRIFFHSSSKKLPLDIKWHFIGALQTNKCKMLAAIPNLWVVETISNVKNAEAMNKACVSRESPLKVFVQVNVSGEESKSGVPPDECIPLVKYIRENCEYLEFSGVMTIGAIGHDTSKLKNIHQQIIEEFSINTDITPLEISMGMSGDFEEALRLGSTNIRVGSTIFGERIRMYFD
ncbi:3603_t:CDS:2 [Ambispora leptoticha]|uniref:Pyridoxal phosphate homeostasis protein n=1 Tax=Ambispora leptoticha TaxID=144679 RepID=A0A9N8YRY0_9GLOM|nr:3603_t:CDS:2 [Ambispora leptoticha]